MSFSVEESEALLASPSRRIDVMGTGTLTVRHDQWLPSTESARTHFRLDCWLLNGSRRVCVYGAHFPTDWHVQRIQKLKGIPSPWLWLCHTKNDTVNTPRLGLCHKTLTPLRTPRLGLCHKALTLLKIARLGLCHKIIDTVKNTKAWAVSQNIDTVRNSKAWAVSKNN